MNRNAESRFALNPTGVNMSRSRFDRSHSLKTTFDVGQLIPLCVEEVLPGDTFSVQTSKVVRLQTLLHPLMDNLYLDTYWFFVPNRLVWDHWENFMGQNDASPWIPQVNYSVPQTTAPSDLGWSSGSLADYLGIPVSVPSLSVSSLPFRAYCKIVNDWFRDENLDDPVPFFTGDADTVGQNGYGTQTVVQKNLLCVYGAAPYVVAKYHDYFTSALPAPQKGPQVLVGASSSTQLPVTTGLPIMDTTNAEPMVWKNTSGNLPGSSASLVIANNTGRVVNSSSSTNAGSNFYVPANLYADVAASSFGIDIRDLRNAFQMQKFYEKLARGGSRYIELIKTFFGVTSPDSRLQRSEYLGGNRIPININQVIQQSATTETSPQGNVAGMSVTTDTHADFTHSFTEHGYVMCLAVCRYKHSYQQGLNRMWSRKTKFDYYWPIFANLSEQGIRNKEIYAQGSSLTGEDPRNDEIFGYTEAWAEYRFHPDCVTGEMRSNSPLPLDSWHLGDDYSQLPSLSSAWIREDKSTVDRVLAVSSVVSNQLFGDFYFKCKPTIALLALVSALASAPLPE